AVEAGRLGEAGEPDDLIDRGALDADRIERRLVEAGQYRDGNHERAIVAVRTGAVFGGPARGLEHGRSTAGVHVDHPHPERGSGPDGAGYRVRDVVKLQVEKDPVAAVDQLAHDVGANGREQVGVDLEAADGAAERAGQPASLVSRVDVERDENRIHTPSRPGICRLPMRSSTRWIACRSRYESTPVDKSCQSSGSTKLAVPTCTAVAPAIRNSSTSSAERIPPIPMIGSR